MTLETLNNNNDEKKSPNPLHSKRTWRATRKPQQGFGLVEKMFWYYDRIKKEVQICRAEQGYYQSGGKTGGGNTSHAFISDPTASIAMKHYQPIAKVIINAEKLNEEVIVQPEKWLTVVEQTLMCFADEELIGELLRRRYLENEARIKTCADLSISEDKYYRLRDTGIGYARECAIQLGLIKVF